jgi:hypothetical protein
LTTVHYQINDLSDLLPSTHGRAVGVSEACIVSMGEEVLHGLGVPFHELIECRLIVLDQLGKKEPRPRGRGSVTLGGAGLLLGGGLLDLAFDVADAGEGSDAYLVV